MQNSLNTLMVHTSINSDGNYGETSSNSNSISLTGCSRQRPWRPTEPRWRKSTRRGGIYLSSGHPGHTGAPGGPGGGPGACTDIGPRRSNETPTGDTAAAPPGRSWKDSSPSPQPSPWPGPGTTPDAGPSLLKPPPSLLSLLHLPPPPPPHGGSSSAGC